MKRHTVEKMQGGWFIAWFNASIDWIVKSGRYTPECAFTTTAPDFARTKWHQLNGGASLDLFLFFGITCNDESLTVRPRMHIKTENWLEDIRQAKHEAVNVADKKLM